MTDETPKRRPGRKAHAPTDAQRSTVKALVAYGIQQEEIARYMGFDAKTLRKYYRDEVETGATVANVKVAQRLFKIATETEDDKTALPALIYWTKARMGWSERAHMEVTGKDGGPVEVQNSGVIVMPSAEDVDAWAKRAREQQAALSAQSVE